VALALATVQFDVDQEAGYLPGLSTCPLCHLGRMHAIFRRRASVAFA